MRLKAGRRVRRLVQSAGGGDNEGSGRGNRKEEPEGGFLK